VTIIRRKSRQVLDSIRNWRNAKGEEEKKPSTNCAMCSAEELTVTGIFETGHYCTIPNFCSCGLHRQELYVLEMRARNQ